eukprot:1833495-Pyramimonas_sp.AAC.1
MAKRRRSCRLCVGLSYSFPSGSVGEKRSRQLRGQARIHSAGEHGGGELALSRADDSWRCEPAPR